MVWVGIKKEFIRMALGFCLSRKTREGAEIFFKGGKIKYHVKSEILLRHSNGLWTLDV